MIDGRSDEEVRQVVLAHRQPFRIGPLEVRPSTREVIGLDSRETIEPRIMQVLVALYEARGEIVTRDDLTVRCWEGRIVGDDAINRVISRIRRVGETVGAGAFTLETITKVGYRLVHCAGIPAPRVVETAADHPSVVTRAPIARRALLGGAAALIAVTAGGAFWLAQSPGEGAAEAVPAEAKAFFDRGMELARSNQADEAVAAFTRATDLAPDFADAWAWVALTLSVSRSSETPRAGDLLDSRSRTAAQRALSIDPRNSAALTAIALAAPLYGDWLTREANLRQVLQVDPAQEVARSELNRVLSNVGRTREAVSLIEPYAERLMQPPIRLNLALDLWSVGRDAESDRVIDDALRRWPNHFPVWFSRYWLYARTGRPAEALELSPRPSGVPDWNFELADLNVRAVATRASGDIERAVQENRRYAERGAGICENAIILAAQLGLLDEAFALAEAYYFGRGFRVEPKRFLIQNSTYTTPYTRRTGLLFTPVMAQMRADPRFSQLTEETGLASYWRRSGTRADVLA